MAENKYCLRCGQKLDGDAQFCPFCGAKQDVVIEATPFLNRPVTDTLCAGWQKIIANWKKTLQIVLIGVVLIIGGGGAWLKINGGLFVPKTISLESQLKDRHTHLWYLVEKPLTPAAKVDEVFVVGKGKTTVYQIDEKLTLAQLSHASNKKILKLAQQQDRKLFQTNTVDTHEQIQEGIKANRAFYVPMTGQASRLYYRYDSAADGQSGNFQIITHQQYQQMGKRAKRGSLTLAEIFQAAGKPGERQGRKALEKALLTFEKTQRYQSPTAVKAQVNSVTKMYAGETDEIDYQHFNYSEMNFYVHSAQKTWPIGKLSKTNQSLVTKYLAARAADDHQVMQSAAQQIVEKLDYQKIIKPIYYYGNSDESLTLREPFQAQVDNQRYLGYHASFSLLITPAQNKGQKIDFEVKK